MISHDNYTFICDVSAKSTGIWKQENEGTARVLSMLPLSHVAAQLVDLVITIRGGANVFFTDPTALQGNLIKFMLACRPYLYFYAEPLSCASHEFGKKLKKKLLQLELKLQV